MYDEHNKGKQSAKQQTKRRPERKRSLPLEYPRAGKQRIPQRRRRTGNFFPRATRSSSPPEPQSTQRPPMSRPSRYILRSTEPLYEREHKRFGSGFHGGGSGHSGSGSGAKKNGAGKMAALALVCALGGGLVGGVAGSAAGNSFLRFSTTVQVSNRTVNEVKEMKVDGKTEMTNSENYAANVNSVVSINVGTQTNFFRPNRRAGFLRFRFCADPGWLHPDQLPCGGKCKQHQSDYLQRRHL